VPREKLWKELEKKGVGGKFLKILQSLYKNQRRKIKTKNGWTEWVECKKGLRQGCVLSPILFALYVDGLQEELQKNGGTKIGDVTIPALLFADDIVLISETPQHLQTQITTTNLHCKKKGMFINFDKSKVMVMGKREAKSLWVVTGKNGSLEGLIGEVTDYKYLGVTINNTDVFGTHKKNKAKFLPGMIAALRTRSRQTPAIAWASDEMWKQCVCAALLYGMEIIPSDTNFTKQMEKAQLRAARWAMKASNQSSTTATLGERGWRTISQEIRRRKLIYWAKIEGLDNTRWSKLASTWATNNQQGKWVTEINKDLNSLNITDRGKSQTHQLQKHIYNKKSRSENSWNGGRKQRQNR
jgi:hypothetical protein